MSSTGATAFLDALQENGALRREWQAAMEAAVQDALLRFAAVHGHNVTAGDLVAALAERERQLSDADLDTVAGGLSPQPDSPDQGYSYSFLRYFHLSPTIVRR